MAAPTVTSVSPTGGPLAGGTEVTIVGTGFVGVTDVDFGGTAADSFTVDSSTSITAVTPAKTAGAANVVVTNGDGASTETVPFTYAVVPTVVSVSPSNGSTDGGTEVTITGTALTGATAVTFGDVAADSFTVDSATQITAFTGAADAGQAQVVVTTPGGVSTENVLFTFVQASDPTFAASVSNIAYDGTPGQVTGALSTGMGYAPDVNVETALADQRIGGTAFNVEYSEPTQ